MKRIFTIIVLFLIITSVFAQDEYIPLTIKRNNTFSLSYYSSVSSNSGNIAVSPFGIACGMSMVYIGSEGKTQLSIAEKMNFITPYGILVSFKQLLKRYQIYQSNEINLQFGNALWLGIDDDIEKKYRNLLKVNFDAHVQKLNFKSDKDNSIKEINRWVKKSSNFNLLSLLKSDEIKSDDELIFTNYVFFDGGWENPFSEQLTGKDDFYSPDGSKKKVDFMNQTSYLKYNENEIFQIIELPYSGGNLSMIVLLPKKENLIDSLEESLTLVNFNFWTSELYTKLINLSFPKFRIEQTQSFSEDNSGTDFELPFSERAQYSAISGYPVKFSRLIQKTIIQVVENKANSNIETFGSADGKNRIKDNTFINFKANHPFIFIVKDNLNGCILLIGKVNSPGFNNISADYYN